MATLRKELREILDKYGIDYRDKDKLWDCHGTLVMYHKAYEIIAAQERIQFLPPLVLEANGAGKSVALCVTACLPDGRTEWATGEAAPGNNKNAYPYAMAEKRAKDRAIAKLVGLAQYVLSEDEVDDFKTGERKAVESDSGAPSPSPAPKTNGHVKPPEDARAEAEKLAKAIKSAANLDALSELMDVTMIKRQSLPTVTQDYLAKLYMSRREAMTGVI